MATDFETMAKTAKHDIHVPWDDLQSARAQKGVLAALRETHEKEEAVHVLDEKRRAPSRPRRRWLYGPMVAVAAVAAAVLLWLRPPTPIATATWAAAELAYKDGSRSLLEEHAQVQVLEDGAKAVKVQQHAGKVRYQITSRPARRFQVRARGVTITVLGTVFDVKVQRQLVTVAVERGKVQVEHNGKLVMLTSGKRLAMAVPADDPTARVDTLGAREPEAARKPEAAGTNAPEAETNSHATTANALSEAAKPMQATGAGGGAPATTATAGELMREADRARGRADHAAAAAALRQLIRHHPRDRRITLAQFNLARVLRAQGAHTAAARTFEQCGRALRGDAIAEAAFSWQQAGDRARAQAAATRYLDAFANGVHALSMRQLSGGQ
jgi:hypothetical protein